MAIELLILSGSRQGERVELDADTFRAGESKEDDLCFESKADPGVCGRRVEFLKTENGWTIRSIGPQPVTLNQKSVTNSMPIRSGDIIRMSDTGPDFSFSIASVGKKTPATTSSLSDKTDNRTADDSDSAEENPERVPRERQAALPRIIGVCVVVLIVGFAVWYFNQSKGENDSSLPFELPSIPEQIVNEGQRLSVSLAARRKEAAQTNLRYSLVGGSPEGARIDEATGVFSWTPTEQQGPGDYTFVVNAETAGTEEPRAERTSFSVHVSEVNQPPSLEKTSRRTFQIEVGEEFRHSFSAVDSDLPAQQLRFQLLSESSSGVQFDEQTGTIVWRPTEEQGDKTHLFDIRVIDDGQPALHDDTTLQVAVAAFDPWKRAVQKISPAVYLLAVEHGQSQDRFPYGTAVAIGPKTLLTSAALAVELEKRRRSGWNVQALQDHGQVRIPIHDIKVHRGFVELSETPAEQIYFDLAILSTGKTLPTVCQLASAGALAKLERGQPLLCIGHAHEGTALTRFDFPDLSGYPGKATAMSSLPTDEAADEGNVPTLLHLSLARGASDSAEMPPINLYGSPIVTTAGDLLSLYVERAEIPSAPAIGKSSIHYTILPALAKAWLEGKGRELWVAPVIKEAANTQRSGSNE